MAKHGLKAEDSLEFVRAYEAAIVETIEKTLASVRAAAKPDGVEIARRNDTGFRDRSPLAPQ